MLWIAEKAVGEVVPPVTSYRFSNDANAFQVVDIASSVDSTLQTAITEVSHLVASIEGLILNHAIMILVPVLDFGGLEGLQRLTIVVGDGLLLGAP